MSVWWRRRRLNVYSAVPLSGVASCTSSGEGACMHEGAHQASMASADEAPQAVGSGTRAAKPTGAGWGWAFALAAAVTAAACGGAATTDQPQAADASAAVSDGGSASQGSSDGSEQASGEAAESAEAPSEGTADGAPADGSSDEPSSQAEGVSSNEPEADEASAADGQGSVETPAVQISEDVADFDLVDVSSGATVSLRSLLDGETPVLLWFWAPH